MLIGGIVLSLAVVFAVDVRTGAAPFQHLYYLPIVLAGLELPGFAGPLVGGVAVILYHLANPELAAARYRESDIVQIILFVAIGLVTARLAADRRRLQRLSITDDLTGLLNLRGFEDRLGTAIRTSRENASPLSILVLDVDRLKSINDTHGHRAGADSVRIVGALIGSHLPAGGFACRFGGDEFVVALPGRDHSAATGTAEALRRAVHAAAPRLAGIRFPAGTLSISVGLASQTRFDEPDTPEASDRQLGEALFRSADQSLYRAKAGGRNQVGQAAL